MWALLATAAYLLLAINGVLDKFLLTKEVKHPLAYAFYVGITGPLSLLLSLFGLIGTWLHWNFLQTEFAFQFLSPLNTGLALLGGAVFPLALYFLYSATQATSISRVLPIEGGLVPIFTLIFAYLILGERLTGFQFLAFFLLVAGAVLISFKRKGGQWHALAFKNAAAAAVLFALSLTLQKYVFRYVNFASGLIWVHLGFFVAAICFLIFPKARSFIFVTPKEVSTQNKFVYLAARTAGGMSGMLQNYAIKIGSVTLVNALQGTQFVFLLAITSVLSLKFPKILKEQLSGQALFQKIIAIIIISLGLWILSR